MVPPEFNNLIKKAGEQADSFALWRLPHSDTATLQVKFSTGGTWGPEKSGFIFHPFAETVAYPSVFIEAEAEASGLVKDMDEGHMNWKIPAAIPTPEADRAVYMGFVERSVKAIRENRFSKIVAARAGSLNMPKNLNLPGTFKSLCLKYPDAFVSLVQSEAAGTWLGATPELLLAGSDNSVSSHALAGTRLQNGTFTGKEYDEQQWVRLYIEDIFRKYGLVPQTLPLREMDAGNGLVHLLNEIKAPLPAQMDAQQLMQLAREMHPTPAVAGTPRHAAMQWIAEQEPLERAYYSGFLGPVKANGSFRLFVNLRCMQVLRDRLLLYAGAGITRESDAEKEWEETRQKMNVIASVLSA